MITSNQSNEQEEVRDGQYGTRGKRLSTTFLLDNTDVDITSENEDDWKSCPIWSKQVIDKKQRYLNQVKADTQKEEEEYGKNEDEEEDDLLDEQDDEEAKYLRKAAKKSRVPPPNNVSQISNVGATVRSASSMSKKKPTTIRQNIKKLMKRMR